MMNYSFKMTTKVIQEKKCIKKYKSIFKDCGKKALIVTGAHSAKASGALNDVEESLLAQNIEYKIFDKIENNPSLETVIEASEIAKEFKAEFIIGIGGGSPIDASKAIAVIAGNDIEPLEIFKNEFNKALKIVAIPTTAGTGSEVTPYSVILRKDLQTKVSFGNENTFPTFALLDSKYTESLSDNTTINTAIDAFTHSLEGYLSNRATCLSDALAIDAIKVFGEYFNDILAKDFSAETREKLMYVSMIGGMVIANTGVTIPHGMGYCYTYFKDLPHGKANGLLIEKYLDYIYEAKKEKVDIVLECLGCSDIKEFGKKMNLLIGKPPVLTEDEIELYTELTLMQKGSMTNTGRIVNKEIVNMLWRKMAEEARG